MAEDERNIPERKPARRSGSSKPAVRRRSAEGASRRPSASSIANRPSAAGQRRSRRRPPKKVTAVGGAAAEVETPQSHELEAQAEKSIVGANVEAEAAPAIPEARPTAVEARPPSKSEHGIRYEIKPATTQKAERSAEPEARASDGSARKATPATAPDDRPEARPEARSAARPAPDSKPSTEPESRPVGKPAPDLEDGAKSPSKPEPEPETEPEAQSAAAERASAVARNVRYSSAHPEGDGPQGSQSRTARRVRARRRTVGKVRGRRSAKVPTEPPAAPDTAVLSLKREQLRQADWHTDDANPYLQEGVEGPQDEYWYEDEEVSPVVPVRDISPQRKRRTSAAIRSRSLLIVLGIFAAMAALTLFVWITRSVEFTLNGADVTTPYGTSLADYIRDHELTFESGNLVSVGGNVLAEGGGDPYAAKVNGETYRPKDAANVCITGGETVELGNGLDVTEDYDSEIVEALPKLEFDGTAGAISFVSQWGMPGKQERLTGRLSGEVALGDFIEQPTNTVVTTLTVVPENNRKLVALTFDDGPSEYTPQYLDILARYNAKATFFMFGPSAERDPEMVKRVVEAGHQVCNHTSVHQDLSAMDAEQLQNELRTTFQQVDNASGVPTTTFRPPWSIFDKDCWLKSGGVASTSVLYTADSRDWDQPGVSAIVSYATEGTASGSIILMHDGGYRLNQDLEALPQILDWLQANGYEMVTLSELFASDPAVPEAVASCNDPMPEGSVWPTEFAETDDTAQ